MARLTMVMIVAEDACSLLLSLFVPSLSSSLP